MRSNHALGMSALVVVLMLVSARATAEPATAERATGRAAAAPAPATQHTPRVLFPVGPKVRLGGLANFYLRNPLNVCVVANGMDTCMSSGVDSVMTLALSFAALL